MPSPLADDGLTAYVAGMTSFAELDVAQLRRDVRMRARLRTPGPALATVGELGAPERPARLYRPTDHAAGVLLYLHGGGWTIGDLDSHDRLCRRLAARAGVAVLGLDYRLAPEHPWPAAVDDVVAALTWLAAAPPELGFAPAAIGVGGDSAGGTLAALACLRLRDELPAALPALQLLVYANTDLTGAADSMRTKAEGWGLDVATVRFFNRQWVPDERRWADPGVSPLHAPDLSGLPAAVIVTAEHDPLRDEAEAYAARLGAAGVAVQMRREPGLIHNFLLLDEVSPACAAAGDRVADDVRRALAALRESP